MQERVKRLAIAVGLTTADVATFNNYSGVIGRTWDQRSAKVMLHALLGLWTSSAIGILGHVPNDIRQRLRERDLALSRDYALAPSGSGRHSDV